MKYLFIDTNVLLDLILDRAPFDEDATALFNHAENRSVELFISSLSIKDVYYLSGKVHSRTRMLEIIGWLDALTTILPVTGSNVRAARASDFTDFEDAIQHECACSERRIQAIVTRDKNGFRHSRIPVLSPAEALLQIS